MAEVSAEPLVATVQAPPASQESNVANPAWIEKTISYPAPDASEAALDETAVQTPSSQPEAAQESTEGEPAAPSWGAVESAPQAAALEPAPASMDSTEIVEEAAQPEPAAWTTEPADSIESATSELKDESLPSATETWSGSTESTDMEPPAAVADQQPTLSGRIQVNISPVPDFDRLLSLDSAVSRVDSVQTVTLADYAQEEVTFRIDLASPLDAVDFARQVAEAAGMSNEVAEADTNSLTLCLA